MPPPEGRGRLVAAASALACPLQDAQVDALLAYLELLAKWNKVYNLTAIRDPDQMLIQHLVDSLAVVPPLRRQIADGDAELLDVGSGGGLPGVVIAVAMPRVRVTCVDAVAKKASFVRQVAAELGLSNLESKHARVEELPERQFDVVTSRAFASLHDFTRLSDGQLADKGVWMAMKAKDPQAEILALPPSVAVFHVEQLEVPELDAERCIVWMRRAN